MYFVILVIFSPSFINWMIPSTFNRSKLQRDKERDISEQIALGLASAPPSQEAMFDQRLFNQSKVNRIQICIEAARMLSPCTTHPLLSLLSLCGFCLSLMWLYLVRQGLDSGYGGDDDVYNVYDKAWRREGSTANAIYRPSKNVDRDVYGDDLENLVQTNRWVSQDEEANSCRCKPKSSTLYWISTSFFTVAVHWMVTWRNAWRPNNGNELFGHVDLFQLCKQHFSVHRFQPDKGFAGTDRTQQRDGPVKFVREKEEEDPFGLDKFLTEAKKGKRPLDEPSRSRYAYHILDQLSLERFWFECRKVMFCITNATRFA